MKVIALSIAICMLSAPAISETAECRSITAPNDRLACYDNVAPPAKSRIRPVANTPIPDPAKYVDTISAEDARMNAQLKNICRGC